MLSQAKIHFKILFLLIACILVQNHANDTYTVNQTDEIALIIGAAGLPGRYVSGICVKMYINTIGIDDFSHGAPENIHNRVNFFFGNFLNFAVLEKILKVYNI